MSRFGLGFVNGGGGVPGNDSFTKILLHMDGSNGSTVFQDVAAGVSTSHAWTASNVAAVDSAAGKFGTGALKGSYISTPVHSDYTLGSLPFTIDMWLNFNGLPGSAFFFAGQGNGTPATTSWQIQMNSNGTIGATVYFPTGLGALGISTTTAFNSRGLTHLAFTRSIAGAGAIRIFTDGVIQASQTTDIPPSISLNAASGQVAFGRAGSSAGFPMPNGAVIEEARYCIGIDRYGASNFTPPNAPYI